MDEHEYWAWSNEQLKQPYRATGGEPCVVCGTPIDGSIHWKLRDRHVCSSDCNVKLKRRWKREIRTGKAPKYERSQYLKEITVAAATRKPRLMRTTLHADFPYEYDHFPIMGDVLERHGHHTMYVPITEIPYKGTVLDDFIEMEVFHMDKTLGVLHEETGAWTAIALRDDGAPSGMILGRVLLNNQVISAFTPTKLILSDNEELDLHLNFEVFRCIDDLGGIYSWQALSFSSTRIDCPLWTPMYLRKREGLYIPDEVMAMIDKEG
ncbi:MAG: hypothetical protein LBN34_03740 [Clostridiales Family XIII bacterium]|jgi:predicted nucleic acid-binding Zn ribbon protein|nr:hypothetical protein [Clostridiales Family XIII bacterium]